MKAKILTSLNNLRRKGLSSALFHSLGSCGEHQMGRSTIDYLTWQFTSVRIVLMIVALCDLEFQFEQCHRLVTMCMVICRPHEQQVFLMLGHSFMTQALKIE